MYALTLSGENKFIEVVPVDKYVSIFYPEAEYMVDTFLGMLIFTSCNYGVKDIKKGFEYTHYLIDNKLYEDCVIGEYENLVKLYEDKKGASKQLSLF